jgi:hypothetical protein
VLVVTGETVGLVGANELGPTVPVMGNTPGVGTAGAELTPRLIISVESNGIPVRAPPPVMVGDAEVGVDDEAMLLEPEPHIPDIPEVSIPEVVDVPDGTDICEVVDVPGVAVGSVVAAVAGVAVPAAIPPPSKAAVDPNIPDDEVPTVEHDVPLLVIAPVLGIAIVPVTATVGAGLTPSDVISVAPIGIPVAPTDPPAPIPSGEVTPSEGAAVSGSATSSWANAGLAKSKGQAAATIKRRFIAISWMMVLIDSRRETIGRRHELWADRISDRLQQNAVDLRHRRAIDAPSSNIGDRRELVGPARAP